MVEWAQNGTKLEVDALETAGFQGKSMKARLEHPLSEFLR
jgi:hypothetical protein